MVHVMVDSLAGLGILHYLFDCGDTGNRKRHEPGLNILHYLFDCGDTGNRRQ